MKASYPIQSVPTTPEYILACFQEEWRQYAMLEMECDPKEIEQQLPMFDTTIHQWRDLMDLVGPWELGRALNHAWATNLAEASIASSG